MNKTFLKNKDPTTLPMKSKKLILNSLKGNGSFLLKLPKGERS